MFDDVGCVLVDIDYVNVYGMLMVFNDKYELEVICVIFLMWFVIFVIVNKL